MQQGIKFSVVCNLKGDNYYLIGTGLYYFLRLLNPVLPHFSPGLCLLSPPFRKRRKNHSSCPLGSTDCSHRRRQPWFWGNQTDLWSTGHKSLWMGRHAQCQISRVSVRHKASLWIQIHVQEFAGFKTDQESSGPENLSWCPCFEESMWKCQDKRKGHWRAALLMLLWYAEKHFLCPSKRNPFLLELNATNQESATKMPTRAEVHLWLYYFKLKKVFFPSRDILECCKIIVLFPDSEVREFPFYLACTATNANHKVFCFLTFT